MDQESTRVAEMMLEKVHQPNTVQQFVEEKNLLRKKSLYKTVEASSNDLEDFPRLTMENLRDITMGVYQIKQCVQ